MRRDLRMVVGSLVWAVLWLGMPRPAQAVPIVLELTIDEITKGRAVLSGDLDDTTFTDAFPGSVNSQATNEVTGTNWFVKTTVFRKDLSPGFKYSLTASARHLKRPPGHVGEAAQGLLLGGSDEIFHNNLGAINLPTEGAPGPQDDEHHLLHPGSLDHYDVLTSHVDDLDPRGVWLLTLDNQISARFDLAHTPEPASLLLFGVGLVGLGWHRTRSAG